MPDKTTPHIRRAAEAMAALRNDAEGMGAIMDLYGDLATAALSLEPSEEEKQEAAWAICPHLRWMLKGDYERPECERCPAVSYYPEVEAHGTRFCRAMADKAANDGLIAAARVRVGE